MSRGNLIHLQFPLFNALVMGILGGLLGYYMLNLLPWLVVCALGGFLLALGVERGLRLLFGVGWLYRRRVLIVALLQIGIMLYGIGPFALLVRMTRANNTPICCQTPARFGATYTDVQIPVAAGVTLAGWYIHGAAVDAPTIMVAHGSGGNRTASLDHAEPLHAEGFNVLVYDQRALGESTGAMQSLGWLDRHDITPIIDYLIVEQGADPQRIGGVGLSLGGQILLTAAQDEPRLRAVWADGAVGQRAADLPPAQNIAEYFEWSLNHVLDLYACWLVGEAPPPLMEVLPRLDDRPVMLIAGAADAFETRAMTNLAQNAPPNIELWVFPNAGHVGGLWADPETYKTRLVIFFAEALDYPL